jgi:hypothetical protein
MSTPNSNQESPEDATVQLLASGQLLLAGKSHIGSPKLGCPEPYEASDKADQLFPEYAARQSVHVPQTGVYAQTQNTESEDYPN